MHFLLENTAATLGDSFFFLHFYRAVVYNNHTVPTSRDDVFVVCALVYSDVDKIRRGSSGNWTFYSENLASDHFCEDFVVFELWNLSSFEFLVLGLAIFVSSVQI